MPKSKLKLALKKETMSRITGGPGHRTTNVCTQNAYETCWTWCPTGCMSCLTCGATECPTGCEP